MVSFIFIPSIFAKNAIKQDEPYKMQKLVKLDKTLKVNYHITRSYNSGNNELFTRTKSSYGYNDLLTRSNSEGRIELYNQLYTLYSNLYNSSDAIEITGDYYIIGEINYISLGLSYKEACDTYFIFKNDYPLFYFASNSFVYNDTTMYATIFDDYKDGNVRREVQDGISSALDVYEGLALEQTENYYKIKAVHDYLASQVTYGKTNYNFAHNIVGALIENEGVCETYARTFELILNYLGIDNIFIAGKGDNGVSNEDHAWNLVKLGNYYYWVDVTWDDQNPTIYNYFMKGNSSWSSHTENTPETEDFLYSLPNNIADISITYQRIEVFKDDVSLGKVNSSKEAFDVITNQNQTASVYELVFDNIKNDNIYLVPGGQWPEANTIKLTSYANTQQGGSNHANIDVYKNITLNSDLTITGLSFSTGIMGNEYENNNYQNFDLNIGNHTIFIPSGISSFGGYLIDKYIPNEGIHTYKRIGVNIIGTTGSSLVAENTLLYTGDRLVVGTINAPFAQMNVSELTASNINSQRISFAEDYDIEVENLQVAELILDAGLQEGYNKTNTREVNIVNLKNYYSNLPLIRIDEMDSTYYEANNRLYPNIYITGDIESAFDFRFLEGYMPGEGFKLLNIGENDISKLNDVKRNASSIRNHFYKVSNGDVLTCLHNGETEHIEEQAASCELPGHTSGVRCSICGNVISGNEEIPATGHNYQTSIVTPATLTTDGKIEKQCTCGHKELVSTIYKPESFILSSSSFVYNGYAHTPIVSVKDSQGEVIESTNYNVTYSEGCTEIGTYNVTIEFNGEKYIGTKTVTFEIVEDPTTYTLSFNSNGGLSSMGPIYDLKGNYDLPECTMTPPEYKQFKGWSLTSNGEIITSVNMNQDRTVYAIWEDLPRHTLSFNSNGGTGSMNSISNLIGLYDLPECTIIPPDNKQFKGWSLTSSGEVITTLIMDQDRTVYAIWEDAPVYLLTFDDNGGTNSMTAIYGLRGLYELPECTIIPPEGKQFKGWSLSLDGEIITSVLMDQDRTVYPVWEDAPVYLLIFDDNGGTNSMTAIYGLRGLYDLPECTIIPPEGKQFKGWSLSLDGEIITSVLMDQDRTVYPIWENKPSYLLTFDDNGGTNSMTSIYELTGLYELPECTIIPPEGKYFIGWSLSINGEIITSVLMDRDRTVYPVWGDIKQATTPVINIKANNNTLTISWDNQEVANKYEVSYSTDQKKWTKATVTTNSYIAKSLTYNKKYYFKVRAYDGTKWTSYSNVVSKKVVPNKVENLVIKSAGTNNVKLGYDKVSVTGYEIYYSTDQKKLRAYKKVSGSKVYGDYSSVVSTKTAPLKPKVTLSIKDYNAMSITIESVKGASVYKVEKGTDGKTYELVSELPGPGKLDQDEQNLGTTYYFRVKACNAENRCSGWVNVSLKQTPKTPKVTLVTTSKKVTITLGKVNGVQGYQIYSATKKNGTYKLLKEFSNEEELLEYVHKTTKGKTYYYKVRSFAINTNDSRVYSSYSSIKSIKSK